MWLAIETREVVLCFIILCTHFLLLLSPLKIVLLLLLFLLLRSPIDLGTNPITLEENLSYNGKEQYIDENEEHKEVIQGIERGDALPGLRSYADIAVTARKVGFEVVKEKDLAKPPAKPWWNRLKMGRLAYWRNHVVVVILSAIGIAPKGTVDVHEMLFKTADYLTRGGETGIFSPMHMILCRKPEKAE